MKRKGSGVFADTNGVTYSYDITITFTASGGSSGAKTRAHLWIGNGTSESKTRKVGSQLVTCEYI